MGKAVLGGRIASMLPIDTLIRTVGVTAAVILGVAMARPSGAPLLGRVCGLFLLLGVAAYLPCSTWACNSVAWAPAGFLAGCVPFFFWGWTQSIMDDEFKLTLPPVLAGIVLAFTPIAVYAILGAAGLNLSIVIHSVMGIAFVIAALVTILRTWREDLVEARRRLRLIVLVIAGVYSIVVMGVELFLRGQPAADAVQLLNGAMLTVLIVTLAMLLTGPSNQMLQAFGWSRTKESSPVTTQLVAVQPAPTATRDLEQELIDSLHAAMTGKAMYRDAELSIAALARFAGVTEKRLREVINRRLGHKNFPSYVNAFRVEEVKARLADTRNNHLPILTLALEAGFGSIVAFNRVFKERYGITPTEHRSQHSLY